MKNLSLSNGCLNCLNIEENTKMCGVHLIEVDEKYTCNEFNGVE